MVRSSRQPTDLELAQERSALYTAVADTTITTTTLILVLFIGSLTLLGEVARQILTVAALYFSIWVLLVRHRNGLAGLEFGLAKLERFVWLVLGLCLVVAALLLGATIVDGIVNPGPVPDPLGFAIIAIVNGVNTMVNLLGWLAMFFASRGKSADSFKAQFYARTTMLINSLVVQILLTGAALAHDASVAHWLDIAGAIFVAVLMIINGAKMIAEAMPDLLDAPGRTDLVDQAREAINEIAPSSGLSLRRSRRAGLKTFLELQLEENTRLRGAELQQITDTIVSKLRRNGLEVEVSVVPEPA